MRGARRRFGRVVRARSLQVSFSTPSALVPSEVRFGSSPTELSWATAAGRVQSYTSLLSIDPKVYAPYTGAASAGGRARERRERRREERDAHTLRGPLRRDSRAGLWAPRSRLPPKSKIWPTRVAFAASRTRSVSRGREGERLSLSLSRFERARESFHSSRIEKGGILEAKKKKKRLGACFKAFGRRRNRARTTCRGRRRTDCSSIRIRERSTRAPRCTP